MMNLAKPVAAVSRTAATRVVALSPIRRPRGVLCRRTAFEHLVETSPAQHQNLWREPHDAQRDSSEAAAECPMEDAEFALAIQVVSQELQRPVTEVEQQFQLLRALLPDLSQHLGCMKAADLVRLSGDVMDVAEKLLLMRDAMPAANISRIVAGNSRLLSMSKEQLRSNLLEVEAMLAPYEPQWQTLLSDAPYLVDAAQLHAQLAECERTFNTPHTGAEPATMLGIMIGMGLGSPKWPSLDASMDESDLLWL